MHSCIFIGYNEQIKGKQEIQDGTKNTWLQKCTANGTLLPNQPHQSDAFTGASQSLIIIADGCPSCLFRW